MNTDGEIKTEHIYGTYIWIHDELRLVYDANGKPVEIVGSIVDITQQKLAEQELKKYREHLEKIVVYRKNELEKLNERLSQSQKMEAIGLLAGGIAHDFSNILSTIKWCTFILQKNLSEDSFLLNYIDQIFTSIKKAKMLIKNLHIFSKKQSIDLSPIDLNMLIINYESFLSGYLGDQIELNIYLTNENPVIIADEVLIEQVLMNLVNNSKDSMPDGGKLILETNVLDIKKEFISKYGFSVLPGKYALLSVSDTGIGVDHQIKEKVFEPFFTTKEVGKGTGLGLSIIYGIIKQLNDYNDIESESRNGTKFNIFIPLNEAHQD